MRRSSGRRAGRVIILQRPPLMLPSTARRLEWRAFDNPCEFAMTQKIFCYHCRVYHPLEQVRKIVTGKGPRWRCIRTLDAARRSREERDAFGRMQTEANRAEARRLADRMAHSRFERDVHP